MTVDFFNGFYSWKDFENRVYQTISENNFSDVAEIGGGANPLLSVDFIEERNINYHVIDISEEELSKTNNRYHKIVSNLESRDLKLDFQYDFIFSQLTVEHIKDIKVFYLNIQKLLKPGGLAYFFFACKTTVPTMLNHLLPEFISSKILKVIQPFRKDEKHGKFKAYYRWCVGPTKKSIRRFEKLNFEIAFYNGYFGHSYYERIPILRSLEKTKTRFLLKHPNPNFCSYTHVMLKKRPNPIFQ